MSWVNYATGESSTNSTYTTTLQGDCEWDAPILADTAVHAKWTPIVTLKPATLEKLSVGTHTVSILFQNGSIDVKLTVKEAPKSGIPATGDAGAALYLALTLGSGLGLGGLTLARKKRRSADR